MSEISLHMKFLYLYNLIRVVSELFAGAFYYYYLILNLYNPFMYIRLYMVCI